MKLPEEVEFELAGKSLSDIISSMSNSTNNFSETLETYDALEDDNNDQYSYTDNFNSYDEYDYYDNDQLSENSQDTNELYETENMEILPTVRIVDINLNPKNNESIPVTIAVNDNTPSATYSVYCFIDGIQYTIYENTESDGIEKQLQFNLPGLITGEHNIEFYVKNSENLTSLNIMFEDFLTTPNGNSINITVL